MEGGYLPDFSGLSQTPTVIKPGGLLHDTSVIRITNGAVHLENLHITGGWFSLAQAGYGAGVYIFRAEAVIIDSCEIYGNTAKGLDGGIYCAYSRLEVRDSLVHNSHAYKTSSVFPTGGVGGGIYVRTGTFILRDSTLYANTAVNDGGAIGLNDATNVNSGETMVGTNGQAGAILVSDDSCVRIDSALFSGNTSLGYGGALYVYSDSTCTVINTIITGNDSHQEGDGLRAAGDSRVQLLHCTVVSNNEEGITALENAELSLTNCIVWGHSVLEITTNKTVHSCDVDGGYPGGSAIMDSNPQFVDPAAMDFRLLASSPCIHAGVVTYLSWDCIGDSRGLGEAPTMGAYETGVPEPYIVGWLAMLACCMYRAVRRSRPW